LFLINKQIKEGRKMSKTTQAGKAEEQAKAINKLVQENNNYQQLIKQFQHITADRHLELTATTERLKQANGLYSYIVMELYRIKPDHAYFLKNQAVVEQLKKAEGEEKRESQEVEAKKPDGKPADVEGVPGVVVK